MRKEDHLRTGAILTAVAWIACGVIVPTALATPANAAVTEQKSALQALGTWEGSSICVGNRSACKNEHVVYRFVRIEGEPSKIRMFADKVLDGKRVPMGKLDFEVSGDRLSCEFRLGTAHGVWEFTISGETMAGTLVVLPERDLVRRASVHRVADDSVPPPPGIEEYGLLESPAERAVRAELAIAPDAAERSSSGSS